jgi:hypothetical protein
LSLLARRHNAEVRRPGQARERHGTSIRKLTSDAGLAFYYSAVTPDCTVYCTAVTVPYILNLQSMLDVLV